jgi:uncharacterized protein
MNKFIDRALSSLFKKAVSSLPIVALMGPRQSGKTALAKHLFPDWHYVSLEDIDSREFAMQDPRGFLARYPKQTIIDEAQRAPDLFSYLQTWTDEQDSRPGQYILTGSQNYLLMEKVSQSLAGRVSIFKLLPLSYSEIKAANLDFDSINEHLYKGGYPRIIKDSALSPTQLYDDYIQTYLERDVRQQKNIMQYDLFHRFIRLCAARNAQILNVQSLANDCGISNHTAEAWLNLLEMSFIIYRLRPHFNNYGKRMIKSPKLYFYDTGLCAALLSIENIKQLDTHYLRGALFESFVLGEIIKDRYNQGLRKNIYYWRDSAGHEIDGILEQSGKLIPLEIKAGQTITADYFKNLSYWCNLANLEPKENLLIYAGLQSVQRQQGRVLSWRDLHLI